MNRDFEREYIMAVDSGYQKSLQWFIQEAIERNKLPPQAVVTKDGIEMTRIGEINDGIDRLIEEVERLEKENVHLVRELQQVERQLRYAEELKTDAV